MSLEDIIDKYIELKITMAMIEKLESTNNTNINLNDIEKELDNIESKINTIYNYILNKLGSSKLIINKIYGYEISGDFGIENIDLIMPEIYSNAKSRFDDIVIEKYISVKPTFSIIESSG